MKEAEDASATPLKLRIAPTPVESDNSPPHCDNRSFLMNLESSLEDKIACSETYPTKQLAPAEASDEEASHTKHLAALRFPATKFLSPFGQKSEITDIKPLLQTTPSGIPL
jgi:hypothetical protein